MRTRAEPVPALASLSALCAFALLQSADPLAAAALPALVVGAAIALLRGELDFARRAEAAQWAFGALLLTWCLATAFAPDPRIGLALSVPPLAAAIVLVLAARAHWTPAARDALLVGLYATAGVQCMQVLLALAGGAAAGPAAVQAAAVPWLVAPNDLAWCTCLLAFLPGTWAHARTSVARAACVLWVGVVLGAALAAESRLALACAVLALGVPLLQRRPGVAVLAFTAAAALLAVAWGKGLASLASRTELWAAAIELGAARPWTGIGPGGFMAALETTLPAASRIDPRGMPWPHSLPLEAFAVLGLPGLAALAAVGLACLRRIPNRNAASFGIMLAASPLVLLEASLLRTWVWFMLALLCGLPARADSPRAMEGSR
ncbi:MAG: O-antigen ligase family protein [Xanthomonadaceae bacterium]|jgi:hypothetical protein|nr:O-antigen ligase family protein [Xanthomonadaceae bacterium]